MVEAQVRIDLKQNRYNPQSRTLPVNANYATWFPTQAGSWRDYFSSSSGNGGLKPNAINDPAELRQLSAFFAWTAWASVTKVLTQEVPYVMTAPWRERFRAELNAPVSVPVEYDPSGKMSQLSSYIAAKVQNEVDVDLATLKCAMNPETKLWSCKGRVVRRTQPLFGPPLDDPKLLKRLVIRATFKPVPITVDTIDGLLVDFWDASEPE